MFRTFDVTNRGTLLSQKAFQRRVSRTNFVPRCLVQPSTIWEKALRIEVPRTVDRPAWRRPDHLLIE